MEIAIKRTTNGFCACLTGPITISIDRESLRNLAALRQSLSISGDPSIDGFWDSLSRGAEAVVKVLDTPLARQVITAIPYGGTVLTAVDVARKAVNEGQKLIAKHHSVAVMVHNAASGDTVSQKNVQSALANPQMAAQVQAMASLLADMAKLLPLANAPPR